MGATRTHRSVAVGATAVLVLTAVAFAVTPSAQASPACPAGSTAVGGSSPLICGKTFTSSGSWTVPDRVTSVDVVVVGGGGGGNGAAGGADASGGGGGGAGEVKAQSVAVTPSSAVTVTVGFGGGGGTSGSRQGMSGQASSFGSVSASRGSAGGSTWNDGNSSGNSNAGGTGQSGGGAGGGAGAGGAGATVASGAQGGAGGAGVTPTYGLFAGNVTAYGGGGGGGGGTGGAGTDGGANGGASGFAGGPAFGYGGGGGGAGGGPGGTTGGPGGNGIVIVRFRQPPAAPTTLVATPQTGAASIAFTSGADGTSAISNYEYSLDGTTWIALSPAVTTSPVTIPSLASGTSYSISLRAVSAAGSGPASSAVSVTTPTQPSRPDPPGAPAPVLAQAGDRSGEVTWGAPSFSGSGPVTEYEAEAFPGGNICRATPPTTSCKVTGLSNGSGYIFRVRAKNYVGWGSWSEYSNMVTPKGAASIVITGSRDTKKPKVIKVSGTTTGLTGSVTPWLRLGAGPFKVEPQVRLTSSGTFRWSAKTSAAAQVYVTQGSVKSNTVTIRAR